MMDEGAQSSDLAGEVGRVAGQICIFFFCSTSALVRLRPSSAQVFFFFLENKNQDITTLFVTPSRTNAVAVSNTQIRQACYLIELPKDLN
jgi:hypothetical protein